VFDKTVDKVVISLGTNDITKSKGDHDQVNINLTHAIHQVKCNFPNSVVGIWETFPSLLQLEAPTKTFTELLSSVGGLLSACPDVSLRSVSSSKLELSLIL
jgi:lysophospholipase L1-like esterase